MPDTSTPAERVRALTIRARTYARHPSLDNLDKLQASAELVSDDDMDRAVTCDKLTHGEFLALQRVPIGATLVHVDGDGDATAMGAGRGTAWLHATQENAERYGTLLALLAPREVLS